MYLSHRMQPIFPTHFAGWALTVRLEKQENHDAHATDGMLEAIDNGRKDSVYVMSIQDGADIAGMGGLMGTAMSAREFSGAIIDGAVRDTAYLKKIGFPVYATGVTPSTLVGHYRFVGSQVPVVIDGVTIHPGDIIAADNDGVVVVPRARAVEILICLRSRWTSKSTRCTRHRENEVHRDCGQAVRATVAERAARCRITLL